jgi:hypothetical protein
MPAAVKVQATRVDRLSPGPFAFADFSSPAVGLDNSGVQSVFDLDVTGLTRIAIQLVVGTAALAAFQIQALVGAKSATAIVLKSTGAQFTIPAGVLIDTSGDLTVLGVGSTGWFVLNVAGFTEIRLAANSSAAASTLAIFGGGV